MVRICIGFQDEEAFKKLRQELSNWLEHYSSYTEQAPERGAVETIIAVETDSDELIAVLRNSGGRLITSPEEIEALLDSSEGDNNGAVLRLKNLLRKKGFHPGFPNASFDSSTKAAVIAFQKAHNLESDGIVGPKTWKKLRE